MSDKLILGADYEHAKSGQVYRALFVAKYAKEPHGLTGGLIKEGEALVVFIPQIGGEPEAMRATRWADGMVRGDIVIITRYSGSRAQLDPSEALVVYVGLYPRGKTWARPVSEWTETVSLPKYPDPVQRYLYRKGPNETE